MSSLNKQIQRIKQVISETSDIGSWNMQSPIQMNPDEIFNYIKNLPIKFHLSTKYGESFKLYPDGINTAINNSAIVRFYLQYLRKTKKTSGVINIPRLDPNSYRILNELIKILDNLHIPEEKTNEPRTLLGIPDKEKFSMENRLLRANCFQLMNALLYEDFFNVDFRHGNVHDIVNNTQLPTNQEELNKLYEQWNNKEGDIRHILFYADVIPIVHTIEKYN